MRQQLQLELQQTNKQLRATLTITTILLSLLLCITFTPFTLAETNATTNSVSTYGTILATPSINISSTQLNVKSQIFYNTIFSTNDYATKSDVWVGHYDQLSVVPTIHQINPNVTCLLYRNIRLVWAPGSYEYIASEYQLFVKNGWILKDDSGNYMTLSSGQGYMVDIGSPGYQQWLANWFKGYLDSYGANGVFLDNCMPNSEIAYGFTEWPINPRTGTDWKYAEFTDAIISLVNTVKDTINPKIVLGNTLIDGAHFYRSDLYQSYVDFLTDSKIDGVLSELWISSFSTSTWYTETNWKKGIDMAVWVDQNFLSKGNKILWTMSDNAGTVWPPGDVVLPSGVTQEQYVTYCYASRLLTINHTGNWINFGTYTVEDYAQQLFDINIGNPSSGYYKNGNLYVRDFTDGFVIVNPTSSTLQITLTESYTNAVNSTVVSGTLSIPAHTGIILKDT